MNNNMILTGDIRCHNEDIKWQSDQQSLKDLYLVSHNLESSTCDKFIVTYQAESIIPLNTVKLYTLTQTRFRAYTKSLELKEYLTQVFKPSFFTSQSKYAIVLSAKRADNKIDDPFNENEMKYPLDTTSYILLYGQKMKQDQSITFQIYGQLIRDPFSFVDLYGLSTHVINNRIKTKVTKANNMYIDESIIQVYRPDIPLIKRRPSLPMSLSSSPSDKHNNHDDNADNNDSNNLLLKRAMNKLKQLDRIREEARKQRPERTLIVTKRKISSLRKNNANIPLLHTPNPLTLSSLSSPFISQPKQQSLLSLSQTSSSQPILTIDKLLSSTTTHHESNNKKQLKLAIWSKLLLLGHDKKAEDTKLFYHSIYQSIQFVTRKTFKDVPLNTQLMNHLIDKHIQFYDSLDSELIENS